MLIWSGTVAPPQPNLPLSTIHSECKYNWVLNLTFVLDHVVVKDFLVDVEFIVIWRWHQLLGKLLNCKWHNKYSIIIDAGELFKVANSSFFACAWRFVCLPHPDSFKAPWLLVGRECVWRKVVSMCGVWVFFANNAELARNGILMMAAFAPSDDSYPFFVSFFCNF